MEMQKQSDDRLSVIFGYLVASSLLVATLLLTGCAGVELGGKLGMYRVDERADESKTVQAQTKPFICYWKQCTQEELAHGS